MSDRIPAPEDADDQRGSEPDAPDTDEFARMQAVMPGFDIIRWAWRPGIAYDLGSEPWRAAGVCL